MYKRGILSGFIKQIDTTLQPTPAVPSDTTQEPEYDLWYVDNDDAYYFAKLKELANYLPTIEPFSKRVEWFFKTGQIWGIEPVPLQMQNSISESIAYSRSTDGSKKVDKTGQPIQVVSWGISCGSDEEKATYSKLYFLRYHRTHQDRFLNKPRQDVGQLIEKYATQVQTERGKRFVLDWLTGKIRDPATTH